MYVVAASKLRGRVTIPPSKSQTIRALLFALLAEGKSVIHRPLSSPDVEATLIACAQLGAEVTGGEESIEITGCKINGADNVIDAGNSGLIFRFVGALAALSAKPVVLTGDHSVRHRRPIMPLLNALQQLGVRAERLGGPILVQGPLGSGRVIMEGGDSQPVSGMLIASSFAPGPVEIFVTRPGEKPWVDLTLSWLDRLGLPYERRGWEYYRVPGGGRIAPFTYTVPGDMSSAAFPVAAALVTKSEVIVEGLDMSDPQGDREVFSILKEMGAELELRETTLHVKGSCLRGGAFDLNRCIDALPVLTALACYAEGKTELSGVAIAREKESDRLSAMTAELCRMGAHIEEYPDRLIIQGRALHGGRVHSHYDHRVAMALTVAGLGASEETVIEQVGCVAKTYGMFPQHLRSLGARLTCI